MEDRDPFVDRLLDASLDRLGSHEPLSGIEDRVLARLRSEPKRASWFGPGWKFAAALAAVTVTMAVVYVYHWSKFLPLSLAPSKSVVTMTAHAVAPHVTAESSQTAKPVTAGRKNHRHVQRVIRLREPQRAATDPRLPVFPTPAPLSEGEKLLLQYAQYAPPDFSIFNDSPQASTQIRTPPEVAPLKPLSPETESNSHFLGRN